LERTTQSACNCASPDSLEVQAIKRISARYDSDLTPNVEELLEGKRLGEAANDIVRDIVLAHATTKGASFISARSKAQTAARKQLERLLQKTYASLIAEIANYKKKKRGNFRKFSTAFKKTLKDAYYKAYELGIKSNGADALLTAGGSPLILPKDKKWIEATFRQETVYLSRFLNDIRNDHQPNRWPHRTGMYVAAIGSVYYTGRVAGTPPNYAFFWVAKIDNRICPQCKYMSANSPYTKQNLPITPASGYTRCLSNCRCGVAVRKVSKEYYEKISKGPTRDTHLRRLKRAR
jgi:hypothetical protein